MHMTVRLYNIQYGDLNVIICFDTDLKAAERRKENEVNALLSVG